MALSQDEQRVLAEIERRLAADDPGLASCLTTFRRPGPATVLRSPRVRIIGSLFTVLLVAMVSLMVYAMIPFRTHMPRHSVPPTASTQANTAAVSAVAGNQSDHTQQSSTSAKAAASQSTTTSQSTAASQNTANRSASAAAAGKAQQAKTTPANEATLPDANP